MAVSIKLKIGPLAVKPLKLCEKLLMTEDLTTRSAILLENSKHPLNRTCLKIS